MFVLPSNLAPKPASCGASQAPLTVPGPDQANQVLASYSTARHILWTQPPIKSALHPDCLGSMDFPAPGSG